MSAIRLMASIGAMLGACVFAANVQAADAGKDEFTGTKFTCLQYTNGLGNSSSTKAQSTLAHLWMLGYLAGYYKGQNKLEMTDDTGATQKLDSAITEACKTNPQNNIMTVMSQAIATQAHKVPKSIMDFPAATYTCGEHVDAKAGDASGAIKADLAEMWAFAFIQGYKNVAAPNMEIPLDSKAPIIGAVNRTCANNRAMSYMDLAAAVAEKVKLN